MELPVLDRYKVDQLSPEYVHAINISECKRKVRAVEYADNATASGSTSSPLPIKPSVVDSASTVTGIATDPMRDYLLADLINRLVKKTTTSDGNTAERCLLSRKTSVGNPITPEEALMVVDRIARRSVERQERAAMLYFTNYSEDV